MKNKLEAMTILSAFRLLDRLVIVFCQEQSQGIYKREQTSKMASRRITKGKVGVKIK